MTTVSPTYILGSWKPLKRLSKHFLISITPTSTNGLSVYLISASLIILSRLCNKTSSRVPKTINLTVHDLLTPITLNLHPFFASKLQLLLTIWKTSSWVYDLDMSGGHHRTQARSHMSWFKIA